MMSSAQPGILAPVSRFSRFLFFDLASGHDQAEALALIGDCAADEDLVLGLGLPLVAEGSTVEGLTAFPAMAGAGVTVPSTQSALWCWLRSETDRGDLVLRTHAIQQALSPALQLQDIVEGFRHGGHDGGLGKDLTGYEDGTENPTGEEAIETALLGADGGALAGSSFVAVQKWVHNMAGYAALSRADADDIIGRRLDDNEEIEEAPESAHVKRTEQEGFEPEAFVVRRSSPWSSPEGEGLMFIAFGHSTDAYERQMRRMAGLDDGITDGLFKISTPVTGGYYWCPPVVDGRFSLQPLS